MDKANDRTQELGKLSFSVQRAREELQGYDCSTIEIVRVILREHSEYGNEKAKGIKFDARDNEGEKHDVDYWLVEVRGLFNKLKASELNGRLVILGLSILDANLEAKLQQDGFLEALEKELKPPLNDLLTKKGNALLDKGRIKRSREVVRSHYDEPIKNLEEDQLGRAAFARFLAKQITSLSLDSAGNSFAIHLDGPWGSGKSTLLNFLKEELKKEEIEEKKEGEEKGKKRWCVIEFNAWQNQRIKPPWWLLMDHVFQQGKGEINFRAKKSEQWWRLISGRLSSFIALVVLFIGFTWLFFHANNAKELDQAFIVFGQVITGFGAIFVAIQNSRLFGSNQVAQNYLETVNDPMTKLSKRFTKLIYKIRGKDKEVAIFVDDLDRCQSDYTIELLEGIQTLFREAPVMFIVAADGRWLHACFEETYNRIKPHMREPGRPLGTLFLEKVFQFSVPVPNMPKQLKEAYWEFLLKAKEDNSQTLLDKEREKKQEILAEMHDEETITDFLQKSNNLQIAEQQALREEAIVRLADPEIVGKLKDHTLKPFAELLEPNPRAMKRLVNAYVVNRALATLTHQDIASEQLALWTILMIRWPDMTLYLEKYSEHFKYLRTEFNEAEANIDKKLVQLFKDKEVKKVVEKLDEKTVRHCALLRS